MMSSRSGRRIFVRVWVAFHAIVEARFEFSLGSADVPSKLRQFGAAEQDKENHEDDEEFLRLQSCHRERLADHA